MKTKRPRRPRAKLGTPKTSEIIYFRCPECKEMQMDVTHTNYVRCGRKYCGRRSFYPACDLTREEYLVSQWGSMEAWQEWADKFDAYMAKFKVRYEQYKKGQGK